MTIKFSQKQFCEKISKLKNIQKQCKVMEERFKALDKSIWDSVKEEQVKLGYRKEVIRLYYPIESVERMLHSESLNHLKEMLADFAAAEQDTLGSIKISNDGERWCIKLPEEASEYIHEHTPKSGFLYDFIDVIARHGISIEDVLNVFRKYSDKLHIEELKDDDFDYLVYFEGGVPDDYRYCLTDEGHHIIYHRFTPEDYDALGI